MALTVPELAALNRMASHLGSSEGRLRILDSYYNGEQRLVQLGLAVPPELSNFVTIVAWPATVVDAVGERIRVEGFRLPGAAETDDDLWRIWQANDLDTESQLAHIDALVYGRCYLCVGAGDPDDYPGESPVPRITVESPLEMTATMDQRTRRVTAALRRYRSRGDSLDGVLAERATLYTPDATIWLVRDSASVGGWAEDPEYPRDDHGLGVVPVVPLVNRPRTKSRGGMSEMERVVGLTDAAARALTNAQVATEVAALPQKVAMGAAESDFVDPETGQLVPKWETYFSSVWAMTNPQGKIDQYSAADLGNFTRIVDHYATMVAGITGLPMRYFGQNTANPPSADAIRADESRLVMNVGAKTSGPFAGAWEQAMRIARRIRDGAWDPDLALLKTKWADPGTPTEAAKADAVTKLTAATVNGVPVMPLRLAREKLGWDEADIKRAEDMDAAAPADPVAALADQLSRQAAPASAGDAAGA